MRRSDLTLQIQIELLRVSAAECWDNSDHATHRHGQRGEIRNRRRRETIANASGYELIAWTHRIDRPVRRMPVEAQGRSAGAIGIVENSVAAPDDGMGVKLVSETETRSEVFEIALHARGVADVV